MGVDEWGVDEWDVDEWAVVFIKTVTNQPTILNRTRTHRHILLLSIPMYVSVGDYVYGYTKLKGHIS